MISALLLGYTVIGHSLIVRHLCDFFCHRFSMTATTCMDIFVNDFFPSVPLITYLDRFLEINEQLYITSYCTETVSALALCIP